MHNRLQRALLGTVGMILALAVFLLGRQNRDLKRENLALVVRFTEPHRGFLVPSFKAVSLSGNAVVIGEMDHDGRQVLFFFTTTCEYCRTSFAALAKIDAVIKRDTVLRPQLFAIALDSAAATRRFADSAQLSVPILMLPSPRLAALYRVRGVPQLMVLDSAGRTTYSRSGELTGAAALDSVLNGIDWRPTASVARASVPPRLP